MLGIPPDVVEREYLDAKRRYEKQKAKRREWGKKTGVHEINQRWKAVLEERDNVMQSLIDEPPVTTKAASALILYILEFYGGCEFDELAYCCLEAVARSLSFVMLQLPGTSRKHHCYDNLYCAPRGHTACKKCRCDATRAFRVRKALAEGRTLQLPAKLRTHCKNGHLLSGDNVYVRPQGWRECRQCKSDSRRQAALRNGISLGPRTHCKNGHEFTVENTGVHPIRGRLCLTCQRLRWRRNNRNPKLARAIVERVLLSLHEGKTLQEIVGKKGGKHIGGRIVRDDRLYAFCRTDPAIGKRIHQLASKNRDAARAEARMQRVPTVTRNPSAGSLKAISSAIAHLPDEIRDDVQIAIWLAYSERRLKLRDIKTRLSEFVRAENKMFSKYVPHGGGIMQSLDQQVYDDGPTRLVDTVTHGLWD